MIIKTTTYTVFCENNAHCRGMLINDDFELERFTTLGEAKAQARTEGWLITSKKHCLCPACKESLPNDCPKNYEGVGDDRCWNCPLGQENKCSHTILPAPAK